MEINSVNSTAPVEQQNLNAENREPRQAEATEAPASEIREAYRVTISEEALRAQATTATENTQSTNSVEQNSEAVQVYTSGGQIAG